MPILQARSFVFVPPSASTTFVQGALDELERRAAGGRRSVSPLQEGPPKGLFPD